jgi:hypothetical protein
MLLFVVWPLLVWGPSVWSGIWIGAAFVALLWIWSKIEGGVVGDIDESSVPRPVSREDVR